MKRTSTSGALYLLFRLFDFINDFSEEFNHRRVGECDNHCSDSYACPRVSKNTGKYNRNHKHADVVDKLGFAFVKAEFIRYFCDKQLVNLRGQGSSENKCDCD